MRKVGIEILPLPLLLLAACGGGPADRSPTPADLPEAPWAAEPLPPVEAPEVLLQQWTRAENRSSCAPVAPAEVRPAEGSPRAATFAGGWGVAWDLPDQRSAFGVAGTGVEPDAQTYDDWPHRLEWADGSRVGYGPEGGTGPHQLAYLRVAGQSCLYNVWSRLGVEHLERLLGSLRFVNVEALGR